MFHYHQQNNNELPSKQGSYGCTLWLPFFSILVCGSIAGAPKEASKGGLIAYLIISILSCLFLFGSAMGAKKEGMVKWAKVYWIEEIVYIILTVYIVVLLV